VTAPHTLEIRTPEGIVFSQPLAGPASRCLAWVLDAVVAFAVAGVLTRVLSLLALASPDAGRALSILAYFAVSIGYSVALEWWWRGQTLGKRLLRLRVVDAHGLRLRFSQIALRNLLRVVDMLPVFYLVGGAASIFNRKAQRLGDVAANTVVVCAPRFPLPDLEQLLAGKYNSLLAYPHLTARLRQRVSPAEAAIPLEALLRRNALAPDARVQLFAELAAHFRAKVPFPEAATEGIADEQYVRNVVDILFRPQRAGAEERPRPGADQPGQFASEATVGHSG
jgi:uncharacterized RDD family membrane protein YckC